jgi:hypothetical protein
MKPRLTPVGRAIITISLSLFITPAYGAERDLRFVEKFQIPGYPEVVVVAEGDLEPRSVGSYALRVYEVISKQSSTDKFIVGLIRPRNGTVEAVRFADLDGDETPEIVVIIRSVGSGGYLSADAFRYRTGSLEFIGSLSGLDRAADPVGVFRDKFKAPPATTSPITSEQR